MFHFMKGEMVRMKNRLVVVSLILVLCILFSVCVITGCGSDTSSKKSDSLYNDSDSSTPSTQTDDYNYSPSSSDSPGTTITPDDIKNAESPEEATKLYEEAMDQIDAENEDIIDRIDSGEDVPFEDVVPEYYDDDASNDW